MLHESLKVKELTIKESEGFRLRIKSWKCVMPADTNTLEFINESLHDGKVAETSTYQFFLTDAEIDNLVTGLLHVKD